MTQVNTLADTERGSGAFILRFYETSTGPHSLGSLAEALRGIGELLKVALLLDPDEAELVNDALHSDRIEVLAQVRADFNLLPSKTILARITYNSPLEVVFTITGGLVLATSWYGQRLLALYDRMQESRRTKAETDLTVAALRIIKDSLEAAPVKVSRERLELLGLDLDTANAATTLRMIDRLEPLDGGGSTEPVD